MTSQPGVCGFLRALLIVACCYCCCFCSGHQAEGLRLFRSHSDSSTGGAADGALGVHSSAVGSRSAQPAMFSAGPVKSGARSAYQLAPFGEGFGFADLFGLFGERADPKRLINQNQQPGGADGYPFQLDENLIQSSGFPSGGILDSKNNKDHNDLSDVKLSIAKGRLLDLGPWNRILLTDRKSPDSVGEDKLNQSLANEDHQHDDERPAAAAAALVSPVILVPGYGGSRLEAKLDRSSSVHYFCDSKTDWTDLWINVKQLLPYMIDCLIDNMRLELDPATNRTHNPAGVDIRVKNGSQVASVEYLNNLQISGFAYFAPIIEQLTEGKLGYERELTIRAAPYDFRKAPNELGDYFVGLKQSSEQLVQDRAGRPISFICHSMGCNNMLYFLHHQTDEWKLKHVRRLISVAAPWAGSVSAMRAAAVGDDLGMPYLFSESKLLLVQRSLPSTIFLFPHRQEFSGIPLIRTHAEDLMMDSIPKEKLLQENTQTNGDKQQHRDDDDSLASNDTVKTRSVTNRSPDAVKSAKQQQQSVVYTADDFRQFFEDLNHPDGYRMWLNTKDLLGSLEAPGVEVWCLVGVGKRTLGRIDYVGDFPTSTSHELFDDGDGTVTIQSANYCKKWAAEQRQPVYYRQFEADHLAILKDANVMRYIERILESDLVS